MYHEPPPSLITDPRDEREHYRAVIEAARERFVPPPPLPTNPVQYSQEANAAADFETLGRLLARFENELRKWHEGSKDDQIVCRQRSSPLTHDLAKKAQQVMGALSREAFREHEQYKRRVELAMRGDK